MTRAWNPVLKPPALMQLEIAGETHELVPVYGRLAGIPRKAVADYRVYNVLDYGIIVSIDKTIPHGNLLHVSVSHRSKLPSWEIMIGVKRLFFPDEVAAVMVMPESENYVNIHEFCLHIWQLPAKWGIQ